MEILRQLRLTMADLGAYVREVAGPASGPEVKPMMADIDRVLGEAIENFEGLKKDLAEREDRIREQDDAMERQRAEIEDLSEKLSDIEFAAPRKVPGDGPFERAKQAISRYEDLRDLLDDYFSETELDDKFDLSVKALGEWLEDYQNARETLAEARTERTKARTSIEPGALDGALGGFIEKYAGSDTDALEALRSAAGELLRDIDWNRPSPHPLTALREALRAHAQVTDDVLMPELHFD